MSLPRIRRSLEGALQSCLLHSASLIVPQPQRGDWRQEWRGELWHVRRVNVAGDCDTRRVTAFCLGAFQDALCMRRAGRESGRRIAGIKGGPGQCLLALTGVLILSYAVAQWLPGVRAERTLWPRKANANLVMIEQGDSRDESHPTISAGLFRKWKGIRQTYFDGLAFYRVRPQVAQMEGPAESGTQTPRRVANWRVARASSNLFTVLGLPVQFGAHAESAASDVPQVILSERVWKKDYRADAHIAGQMVHLGARDVLIAGVAPDGSVDLPGQVDAWILSEAADQDVPEDGFVVAHLTAAGASMMWSSCVHISTTTGLDALETGFLAVSVEEWKPKPETFYLFAVFLALLSLPALTSVSLGEYSLNPRRTSWTKKLVRLFFLTAKVALLLPMIYFVSIDLAYGRTTMSRDQSIYIQLLSTFVLSLFGLCWVLKDQRQRCPVCMRRVTHPAQVGQASRTFLDWNGTEMMCAGGHTLLHVPSMPTSWFATQRWLYLDTSWDFLFAGSTRPIP